MLRLEISQSRKEKHVLFLLLPFKFNDDDRFIFIFFNDDRYEPDGKRWAPDWRQVVGVRSPVRGPRAFVEQRRAAILSSRLRITKNSSAPHYRAAEVGGAAGECGIFRQSS